MTEFTKEFIKNRKETANNILKHEKSTNIEHILSTFYIQALDEIERQRDSIEALESWGQSWKDNAEAAKKVIAELELFEELTRRWSNKYYRDTEKLKSKLKILDNKCSILLTGNELFRNDNKQLKRQISELEQERRWIPVSEKPKHSGEYWVCFEYDGKVVQGYCEYNEILDSWDNTETVTHWQPLPQLPKDE